MTATTDARPTVPETPLARKATQSDARLKVMAWGEPGSGKSRLALSFPAPLVVDLERSTALYADEFDFLVCEPTKELKAHQLVYSLVKQIQRGMYPDRQTLVIDPMTDYLESLEAGIIDKMKAKGVNIDALQGLAKARIYGEINDGIRQELSALLALPLHVVFVVRAKNTWGKGPDGKMAPIGRQPDVKEIVPYLADIVIKVEKGGEGLVEKSRLAALPSTIKAVSFFDINEALTLAKKSATESAPVTRKAMP